MHPANYPRHTRYYLGFNLVVGIGPARLARLIARCGSVEAAWRADAFDMAAAGLDARSSAALAAAQRRLDLDAELARAAAAGVALLTVEDAGYPRLLREAPAAPPLIYVRGALTPADDWAVAVVGTRSPTSYGREAALRISRDLAAAGVTVVSGMALGIDGVAHQAALEAGGRTIAVLGSGVDLPYPGRHRRLAEQIAERGALISDYPLGTAPAAANFPPRNRIIAGLSRATLVVEAGQSSGSLITVECALDGGRDVFAVPGPIFSRQSEGAHRLIQAGAQLITGAGEILGGLGLDAASAQQEARVELPANPTEARLLGLLAYTPCHVDELARAAGLAAAEAAAALTMLELKGLARQAGPLQYVLGR